MSQLDFASQPGLQTDLTDLELLLDSGFGDLGAAFAWPDQNQSSNGPILPSLDNLLNDAEPPIKIPATLGHEDLYSQNWRSPTPPQAQQSPFYSSPPTLIQDNNCNFGQSFDLPDLNRGTSGPLQHSPVRPAMYLPTRQASGNAPTLSPRHEDDADIRVTYKDKMNPPADPNKALSLAERNKQAQRRHRQRQKDRMGMLEAQVKQLMDEKQELAAEKATLAGQNAVLTQILRMRDEQLQQVQVRESPTAVSRPESSQATQRVKEEVAENDNRTEGAVSTGLAETLANTLTLTVRRDQEIKLSPSQVKAMAPQDISQMWAEYLSAMMKELEVVDAGPSPQAELATRRIKLLLQEVLVLLMRYALGDLRKMKTFVVSYSASSENAEIWRAASHNMCLSADQKKQMVNLRQLFLSKQNRLVAERLNAIADMQVAIPNPARSHDIALQFLKTEQAIKLVQTILHKENQLIVDLVYTVLLKVATPIQAARCLVSSFPSYPDSLCILTWIAAEAGDLEAMKMLNFNPPTDGNMSSAQSLSGGDHSG